MTFEEAQKEYIKQTKKIIKENYNTRDEQLKQKIKSYIIGKYLISEKYKNKNTKIINGAIYQAKFELLENQNINITNDEKISRVNNYLDWLKEENKNKENLEIILKILLSYD